MKILKFEGTDVQVRMSKEQDRILFNTEDIAKAVGYNHVRSLYHHTSGTKKDIVGVDLVHYMDVKGLKWLAKRAYRTKAVRRLADWAVAIKLQDIADAQPAPKPNSILSHNPDFVKKVLNIVGDKTLYGIQEAAAKLGMPPKEFSNYLVDEGFAGRYLSNNNIYWHESFKKQGFGTLPVLDEDTENRRQSNVAKITAIGMEYLKNRLNSKRETGVLAFAQSETVDLEKEIDALILRTFAMDKIVSQYNKFLNAEPDYRCSESNLMKRVKAIIAEVKLKEK